MSTEEIDDTESLHEDGWIRLQLLGRGNLEVEEEVVAQGPEAVTWHARPCPDP